MSKRRTSGGKGNIRQLEDWSEKTITEAVGRVTSGSAAILDALPIDWRGRIGLPQKSTRQMGQHKKIKEGICETSIPVFPSSGRC
jgi:hypothetical protein